eukprot:TRINITY_DN5584_c0_g2_i8.p1 TRINITY_DN5584_c0_g2~~TRINITY_DN5584_c0_g2_i8.p1  ORF type:complete len:264 (+),score=30.90 TRINITY_DN5584_c0_g2_i8:77-868(+)
MSNPIVSKVFFGTLIHSKNHGELEVLEDTYIGVSSEGTIVFVEKNLSSIKTKFTINEHSIIHLGKKFLIPGLVDTHLHAPQYVFTGTGTGIPLLQWLNTYTFHYESMYKDVTFAHQVYPKVVKMTLRNGTTTACYFATIHLEATKYLAEVALHYGQRALIGKVCMDRNSPDYYVESTKQSLEDTEEFIKFVKSLNSDLISPVVTPRFAPTSTEHQMKGLAEIAKKHNLMIQTHISENLSECDWVEKTLFPGKSYSQFMMTVVY